MHFKRFISRVLQKRMEFFPVTLLVGPRQSGKTTLSRQLAETEKMHYVSFDDFTSLSAVQLDPVGYLERQAKPLVLDEVQRAPELFLPLKVDVDTHRLPGRYILTGSANPLVVPKLGDALTGRMNICHMWPLSQGEILGKEETFIDSLFAQKTFPHEFEPLGQKRLVEKLVLGGFPALHLAKNDEDRRVWCNDYLSLTLQKDIRDLANIESFAHLPALLLGLSSRVASTINIEELGRLISAAGTTVRRYLQLFENLYLTVRLPAWAKTNDKRLVKAPKLYFVDSALLLHILDMPGSELIEKPHILGPVAENFIIMEIIKQATWATTNVGFYHWREERGAEVDLVLESARKIVGVAIKTTSTIRQDDIKGLLALQEKAKEAFVQGIILYMGNKVVPFGKHITAVPIAALWS